MVNSNRIALGTVQIGLDYGVSNSKGQVSISEAREILALAKTSGITTLDTAIAYGQSEEVLGKIGIDNYEVISKLPAIPQDLSDISTWVDQEVTNSLTRLQIRGLYGLLLHRPEHLSSAAGADLYKALCKQKELGRVNKIGISIYSHDQLPGILEKYKIDLIQVPLNILDRSIVESGWSKKLVDLGIELHVRSVFLQGLLLMGVARPSKFNKWKCIWDQWEDWLVKNQISPLEACLRFVMSIPEVSKVVVGVESSHQLKEIISASNGVCPDLPNWQMPIESSLTNPANWNNL